MNQQGKRSGKRRNSTSESSHSHTKPLIKVSRVREPKGKRKREKLFFRKRKKKPKSPAQRAYTPPFKMLLGAFEGKFQLETNLILLWSVVAPLTYIARPPP
jgi:hypothetical protein